MRSAEVTVQDSGTRARAAERARLAYDIRLPPLRYFNSAPCDRHAPALDQACEQCGAELRRHQRTGTAWLYAAGKGLLADSTGSGKTLIAAAVLALCKESGELGEHNRAVVICRAAAVLQWAGQLRRFLPDIQVAAAVGGSPTARGRVYSQPWEILVISDRTFSATKSRDGDVAVLAGFPVGIVIFDDLDALRHRTTRTAVAVRELAAGAPRVFGLHATPLQKKVTELHSFLEPLGGTAVFGSLSCFRRNFVQTGQNSFWQRAMTCNTPVPCHDHPAGMVKACSKCKVGHVWPQPSRRCPHCGGFGHLDTTGRTVLRTVITDVGVKNLEEFRWKLAPFVLRRTEFGGDGYPDIQVSRVWLELTAVQKCRYAELQHGVLRRLLDTGVEISHAEAAAAWVRGWQICAGLATLDDGRDVSSKLDWAMDKITGDLEDQKVVVFSYFRPNVAALSARLEAAGVDHVVFWSQETDPVVREERRQRFMTDPACRVLIGTTTIEQSLNLQAASHLILVDSIMNPARITQIIGRIRRQGSVHQTCFIHQLLIRGSQEEAILPRLAVEQGLSDSVWAEAESGIFPASLAPAAMMRMIAGSGS
jgi:SNF2 family DNA or RNA helicase